MSATRSRRYGRRYSRCGSELGDGVDTKPSRPCWTDRLKPHAARRRTPRGDRRGTSGPWRLAGPYGLRQWRRGRRHE